MWTDGAASVELTEAPLSIDLFLHVLELLLLPLGSGLFAFLDEELLQTLVFTLEVLNQRLVAFDGSLQMLIVLHQGLELVLRNLALHLDFAQRDQRVLLLSLQVILGVVTIKFVDASLDLSVICLNLSFLSCLLRLLFQFLGSLLDKSLLEQCW